MSVKTRLAVLRSFSLTCDTAAMFESPFKSASGFHVAMA